MSRWFQRIALLVGAVATLGSCADSNGPRTGTLSLTISGLPESAAGQVTVSGPNDFSRVLAATGVVAGLRPGLYHISAAPVRDGATRYSPLADTQTVTIARSNVPVEASVDYAVSSAVLIVTVDGAPASTPADVRVTGPDGFSRTLTSSTTFDGVDPGYYLIGAREIEADQQRFAPTPSSRQVQLTPGLTPTTVPIRYAQTTGNLRFVVTGLPEGVAADITVSGPATSFTVQASRDSVGVSSGPYTVTARSVTANGATYIPNFGSQTITLSPATTAVVTVNYARSDGLLNLTIDGVTLTQSVQTYSGTVPLVAGRDGYVRVFARANQSTSATTNVRVKLFMGTTLVNTMTLTNASAVPIAPDQGDLATSWNGIIPGQFVQPGLRMLADVDPANTVMESNEADNTFPASGTPAALDVREVPPLRITFVPVIQRYDKTLAGNIAASNTDQFLGDARRMLPLRDIDVQIHAPYTTADSLELTSSDGNSEWLHVLSEMDALRVAESSVRHYFGVVKVNYNTGIAGYGYIGGQAVVAWDYLPSGRTVAAHELTHNFGRLHAPCGGVADRDPNFPNSDGSIGVYGYDLSTNTLRLPSSPDLMGYCTNPWISDYNYVGVMDWRGSSSTETAAARATSPARPALLVWGRVERGQLVLEPAFPVVTRPLLPTEGGAYRIEGTSRDGRRLFSYSFVGERPADLDDPTARHFAFAIPMDEAARGELTSIRLSGPGASPAVMQTSLAPGGVSAAINTVDATATPGGAVRVQWGATGARMALIRDGRTGEILSFARGGTAQIRTSAADLEVILSDGVRSATRTIRVIR
ncbi:MAG TPA: hypothetical protein VFW03_06710 [Gemmatimonadaceae bacterium]|nr:hypothetical protein [Gemmatimonadaceae bacterium]